MKSELASLIPKEKLDLKKKGGGEQSYAKTLAFFFRGWGLGFWYIFFLEIFSGLYIHICISWCLFYSFS